MSLKKQFSKTKCKVTFTLPKSAVQGAKNVKVLGEFNEWNPSNAVKMKSAKNEFKAIVELPVGRDYQFRYLVNDTVWENDWNADNYVRSPYDGIDNSVVFVRENMSTRKPVTKAVATKRATAKKTTAKKATTKRAAVKSTAKKATAKKATTKKTAVKSTAKKATAKKATTKKVTAKKATAKKTTTKKVTAKKATAKKATTKKATAKKATAKKATAKKGTTKRATASKSQKDNLKKIEGIGPKIEKMFNEAGIMTWSVLSKTKVSTLKAILKAGGPRYTMHNPSSWPAQSKMAAKGQWDKLAVWQNEMNGGK